MIKQSNGILRIGTSGIVVPGNKQSFPPSFQLSSRLNYYSSLFNTLEVNSTFYKVPKTLTLQKWLLDVPGAFQFTIKLSKEITHAKGLNIELTKMDDFFNAINYIENKKGCLLVQFPGSITIQYQARVEQILLRLRQLDVTNQWRKAIEFRSPGWYVPETLRLLKLHKACMVLHDMPKAGSLTLSEAEEFAYFRFHGPKGDYRGSYSNDFIKEQAETIKSLLYQGTDVYAYFNNTMGSAFDNAILLKTMVEKGIN